MITDNELRRKVYNNFISGKPNKSGNYVCMVNGEVETDDFTISGGGHWWNAGAVDKVMYDPDSFLPLGL